MHTTSCWPRLSEPAGGAPPARDALLEEMVWLATDIYEERKWKVATARVVSRAAAAEHTRLRWMRWYRRSALAHGRAAAASGVAASVTRALVARPPPAPQARHPPLGPAGARAQSATASETAKTAKAIAASRDSILASTDQINRMVEAARAIAPAGGGDAGDAGAGAHGVADAAAASGTRSAVGRTAATDHGPPRPQLAPHQAAAVSWLFRMYDAHLPAILCDDGAALGKPATVAAFLSRLHSRCERAPTGLHVVVVPTERRLLPWATAFRAFCPNGRLSCACNTPASRVCAAARYGGSAIGGAGGSDGVRVLLLTLAALVDPGTTRALSGETLASFTVDRADEVVAKWLVAGQRPNWSVLFRGAGACHRMLLMDSLPALALGKSAATTNTPDVAEGSPPTAKQTFSVVSYALLARMLMPHVLVTLKNAVAWVTTYEQQKRLDAGRAGPLSSFVLCRNVSDRLCNIKVGVGGGKVCVPVASGSGNMDSASANLAHVCGMPRDDGDAAVRVKSSRVCAGPRDKGVSLASAYGQLRGIVPVAMPSQSLSPHAASRAFSGEQLPRTKHGRVQPVPYFFGKERAQLHRQRFFALPMDAEKVQTRLCASTTHHTRVVRGDVLNLHLIDVEMSGATKNNLATARSLAPTGDSIVPHNTTSHISRYGRAVLGRLARAYGGVRSNSLSIFSQNQLARLYFPVGVMCVRSRARVRLRVCARTSQPTLTKRWLFRVALLPGSRPGNGR